MKKKNRTPSKPIDQRGRINYTIDRLYRRMMAVATLSGETLLLRRIFAH